MAAETDDKKHNLKFAFANATHSLCFTNEWFSNAVKLLPFRIKRSNATVGGDGAMFSRAFCDTELHNVEYLFGDIFQHGISLVTKYLTQETLPDDKTDRLLLRKLLDIKKEGKSINLDPQKLTETELAVLLANHLFGKLATYNNYVIDKSFGRKGDEQCVCDDKSCKMTGHYGDTSVGNIEVWHGNLDIIINNDLSMEHLETPVSRSEEMSPAEVKVKSEALSGTAQIISKAIVFSFLQKQTHPVRKHFLTPCIGVGNASLIVMFYDSEHDVIFESSPIPLFQTRGVNKYEFDDVAILVAWLSVNHKFLCSGLTEEMKKFKCGFFKEVKEKLKVYEDNLQLGNSASFVPVPIFQKRSLQWSSFIEETENDLIGIIHREKKKLKLSEEKDLTK